MDSDYADPINSLPAFANAVPTGGSAAGYFPSGGGGVCWNAQYLGGV